MATDQPPNPNSSNQANLPGGTLVLVVHGVGDPTPGQILRSFAACLASRYRSETSKCELDLNPVEESIWVPVWEHQSGEEPDRLETVVSHIQRGTFKREDQHGTINEEEVVFSEVFWADLSLVRKTLWGVLTAFFEIVFGLPHVVRESLKIPNDPDIAKGLPKRRMRLLAWLCNHIASFLLGPVAALNGLLLGLLVVTVLAHAAVGLWHRDVKQKLPSATNGANEEITSGTPTTARENGTIYANAEIGGVVAVPLLLAAVALIIGFGGHYHKGRWEHFWWWVMACSLALLAWDLAMWRLIDPPHAWIQTLQLFLVVVIVVLVGYFRKEHWEQFWVWVLLHSCLFLAWDLAIWGMMHWRPDWFPILLLAGVPLIIGFVGYCSTRHQRFWQWFMVCFLLILAAKLTVWSVKDWHPNWGQKLSTSEGPVNVLQMVVDLKGMHGFIWHGAVIVFAMASVMVLNSVLMIIATLVWMFATMIRRRERFEWFRYPLHAGFTATALMMGLWSLLIPLLWQFGLLQLLELLPERSEAIASDMHTLHRNTLPLMVLYTAFASVLALSIGVVALMRFRWSKQFAPSKVNPDAYGSQIRLPLRLIVNLGIVWTAWFLTLLGSVLLVGAYLDVFFFHWLKGGGSMELAEKVTLAVLSFLALFSSLLIPKLVITADILLDVINHFRYDETAKKKPRSTGYWIRDSINDRFYQVLRRMLSRYPCRRLCIISHSQGTVIAIDNLNSDRIDKLLTERRVKQVELVTMGSPFEHLYQYYFPASYPTLDKQLTSHWERFHDRQVRWVNIFRVDDFVGTHILDPDDPAGANQSLVSGYWAGSSDEFIRNKPVRPGGHNDYWTDLAVLRVLASLNLFSLFPLLGSNRANGP
jgi:hypothetical protein